MQLTAVQIANRAVHRLLAPRQGVGAGRSRQVPAGQQRQARRASLRGRVQAAAEVRAPGSSSGSFTSEDEEVALLRPVLANTELEAAPLQLAFDAQRDGWSAAAFHAKLDNRGAALVVALTAGGEIMGGYAPFGWDGQGQDTVSDDAFLFFFPEGDGPPVKLPKVGGPEEAVIRDEPDQGIWFGRDALVIPLAPGKATVVRSKLGAYYARKPNGARHLFSEGSPVKGGSRGTELASLRVWVAAA